VSAKNANARNTSDEAMARVLIDFDPDPDTDVNE